MSHHVAQARWRLLVSDLDGTLVTGTTVADHLDAWIGHGPVVRTIGRRFNSAEISNTEAADQYAPHFRGIALADAAAALTGIPSLGDIRPGITQLAASGVEAVIATAGWSFGADVLAELWGFTGTRGVDLEVDTAGTFTGRVERHCEPEDKIVYVAEQCERLGITFDQVVAIGDGRSDLPLFEVVGFSVAVNATQEAQAVATVTVDSASFLDAIQAVPGLLPPR